MAAIGRRFFLEGEIVSDAPNVSETTESGKKIPFYKDSRIALIISGIALIFTCLNRLKTAIEPTIGVFVSLNVRCCIRWPLTQA